MSSNAAFGTAEFRRGLVEPVKFLDPMPAYAALGVR
jgi:hypothetical protein